MKLEQQCVSLELAKKLKELGVKQDSLFYWYSTKLHKEKDEFVNYGDLEKESQHLFPTKIICSAFTVAELWSLLPKELYVPYKGNSGKKRKYPQHIHLFSYGDGQGVCVNYTGGNTQETLYRKGDTMANALAIMLIWLIENKYLEQTNA